MACAATGGTQRPYGRGSAGLRARHRRDHGGSDGHRPRHQHPSFGAGSGAHAHRQYRGRVGRGAGGIHALSSPLPHGSPAVSDHVCREPQRRIGDSPGAPPMTRFAATPFVKAKLRREAMAGYVALGMLVCILLPLFAIVGDLLWQAAPSLTWQFLTTAPTHGMREGGVWPAFIGTLYLVFLSLAVAAPIGALAAVYLTEYAKDNWFNHAVNIAVLNLAGVPSIVHALFGLGAFVYGARLGYSVLSASLTLAIMTMPVIIASTREALLSVPRSYREACWNLGASRWQTIRTIVLPNAISGILTGVILQVSRAAGETAPIMFTGAVFYKTIQPGTLLPYALDEQCMALSMHLYTLSTQKPGVAASIPNATAVLLLGLVFLVNWPPSACAPSCARGANSEPNRSAGLARLLR